MTDYTITAGRSGFYPAPGKDFGGNFVGSRATFCLPSDLRSLDTNTLAIPGLPITILSASPVMVGEEFFGMSVQQRVNDGLAGVIAKTVRSHDIANGKGRWKFIETSRRFYDWRDLDAWVNTHYAAGRNLVFTLFGTPAWASARPTEANAYSSVVNGVSYNLGMAAEPVNMADWDSFCSVVATRYLGKIKYYEVWNEVNYQNNGTGTTGTKSFWTGAYVKLAEMVRRANQAIKAVDPTAKIISPSIQGWSATANQASETFFTGMMSASDGASGTMKDWVDIISVHLYMPAPNKIQDLAGIIDRINAAKATAGVSDKETWDTESAPIAPDVSTLTDDQAKMLIARSMLTMAAKGIARHIYYQYDHNTMGVINRPQITAYREQIAALLRSGSILSVSRFADGRVAYYTNSGLMII